MIKLSYLIRCECCDQIRMRRHLGIWASGHLGIWASAQASRHPGIQADAQASERLSP